MSRDLLAPTPLLKRAAWRLGRILARDLTAGGAQLLSRAMAEVTWWCDARGRKVVEANLAPLIPAPEARTRAARRCYRACADHLAHMLRMDRAAHKPRANQICDPWGVFTNASENGGLSGPLILATLHQDWTRILAALQTHGLIANLAVIALPAGDTWADAELAHLHQSLNATVLPWAQAPRLALRHLRSGGVVGLLADRDYAGDGLEVQVAGRTWRVPTGPAKLAWRTGAPVVPFVWIRQTLVVGQPLHVRSAADVATATRALARFQLRVLAANPARWVAFHPVWGRR
jgi:lauroyl/myristoyl acyltransferase